MMEQRVQLETSRLQTQDELDGKKSRRERNQLGQFATPTALAREVLTYGLALLPDAEAVRFLDPAIGTGSFYSALLSTLNGRSLAAARGYEIDPHYALPARDLWRDGPLDIHLADFTTAKPPKQGFNLLICNPPYVRHHHLSSEDKARLHTSSYSSAGIRLSGLAGLYCHFLAHAHQWMSQGGVAGWLIPSEFMDVNYGRELKRYLLEDVTLLAVHRFDPNDVQFDDALVSSAVVWFRKGKPPAKHEVKFSYGGTLALPALSRDVSVYELAREAKWTRFPSQGVRAATGQPKLSDVFVIKRGIATGNNKFFILSIEQIQEHKLPMQFFKPILPSPRFLDVDEISADTEGNPVLSNALFLLDCRLPESEVQERYPSLWRYLESGRVEMASRYLCKSRPLWYRQEERSSTSFICTYMGRSNSKSGRPFRFLLNHSRAIAANTYLMLYPKPEWAEKLMNNPDATRRVWELLNRITPESMLNEGRVYGGGLHKLEPKELAQVPASEIVNLLREV